MQRDAGPPRREEEEEEEKKTKRKKKENITGDAIMDDLRVWVGLSFVFVYLISSGSYRSSVKERVS